MWHPRVRKSIWSVYNIYEPLWKLLTPEAREKILKGNYEKLFDKAQKGCPSLGAGKYEKIVFSLFHERDC